MTTIQHLYHLYNYQRGYYLNFLKAEVSPVYITRAAVLISKYIIKDYKFTMKIIHRGLNTDVVIGRIGKRDDGGTFWIRSEQDKEQSLSM